MMNSEVKFYILLIIYSWNACTSAWSFGFGNESDKWGGKWFPHATGESDRNEVINYTHTNIDLHDSHHGIKMGIPTTYCDDAKTNLEQDWLDNAVNYTCYDDKTLYLPRYDVYPIFIADHIPAYYSAQHECMNNKIFYNTDIPTFGTHRPLWAKYGSYKFLPKQRWIHNLEHGAVVMLYHPCANRLEVNILRNLVEKCLYRHVITPYNLLTPERPLALVTWGKKLVMSKVDPIMVQEFIIKSAKHGAEHTAKDGQYDYGLINHAKVVSTPNDDVLCPEHTSREQ